MNTQQLLETLQLPLQDERHLTLLRYILRNEVNTDVKFAALSSFEELHKSFNEMVKLAGLDETCIVKPTDSVKKIRGKCEKAFGHGVKHYPMKWMYAVDNSPFSAAMEEDAMAGGHQYHPSSDYALSYFNSTFKKKSRPQDKVTFTHRILDPDAGLGVGEEEETLDEKKTSTERVRKYYKNNREKVRKHLRDTQDDRVARNRDRRKAVKKHGKSKMKNHDVHHPNGAKNGNWRLAKKDHGPDKKNEGVLVEQISENIHKFVEYAAAKLKLQNVPTISIMEPSPQIATLGTYTPVANQINVVVRGRLMADILRTIAHELAHRKQEELGLLGNLQEDGDDGSDVENNANAVAGVLLRKYGKLNREIYFSENADKKVICVACSWKWNYADGGKRPYICHKCWHDNKPHYTQYLMEGGAAGHLAHPYEDTELTFNDMREMARRGLTGELGGEAPVTEKLDGQNLAVSYRDGKVIFSRNPGQTKNRGEKALVGAEGVAEFFKDHPAEHVRTGFTTAAEDLESAIMALPEEERERMFAGGLKFGNLEVMSSSAQNAIPYGKNVLIFHGTIEYDEDGNEVGRSVEDGQQLADMITRAGAEQQKTYGISGPRSMAFSDADRERNEERSAEYTATFDRLQSEFDLPDDATLEDYQLAWWDRHIDTLGIDIPNDIREGLVRRWAMDDKKALKMTDVKDKELRAKLTEYEAGGKTNGPLGQARKAANAPFRKTFLRIGVDTMRRVTNILAANNPAAAQKLKQELVTAIKEIRDSGDEAKLAILQRNLEDLAEAGIDPERGIGMDDIVPSEGIVFVYNGNTYKFTGAFAPSNQILGTMKFDRGGAGKKGDPLPTEAETSAPPKEKLDLSEPLVRRRKKAPAAEEPTKEEPATVEPTAELPPKKQSTGSRRKVAIVPGRFQPFHPGHFSMYQRMVDEFGADNVYIATSDDTDPIRSPMSFRDKQQFISKMFDIPEDRIVQTAAPYKAQEITSELPEDTTVVFALSEKDAERMSGGKYFSEYDPETATAGYREAGYFVIAPVHQMEINGKNVSGTQMRRVLGDPNITDRAKQEMFTKAYGKFDPDMFDMIVKKTTESEEARKITSMYAPGEEPDDEESLPPEQRRAPLPADIVGVIPRDITPEEKLKVKAVLDEPVLNQDTGRKIKVKSALGKQYAGTQVQAAAQQMVKTAIGRPMAENTNLIREVKEAMKLKVYLYTRDYTEKELENESNEYFKNKEARRHFPKLARTSSDLQDLILDAPTIILTREELEYLGNSEVPEILEGRPSAKVLKKIEDKYGKYTRGLLKMVKNEEQLPLPVVIKHRQGYYLLGGNTRLSVLAALGHTMPVKVLDYDHPVDLPMRGKKLSDRTAKKLTRSQRKKIFNTILRQTIINPETGNEIKIDTAMDYNRNHPAHKVAMNIIRQKMAGISTRAGIPKKRKK